MMKKIFALLLLVSVSLISPAFSQKKPATPAEIPVVPGCGNPAARFEVKEGTSPHPVMPEPGKALVYFFQDDSQFASFPKPTDRVGIDGAWVGATHRDSYFYFSVDPGARHICVNWQGHEVFGERKPMAAMQFRPIAGGVYYFLAKDIYLPDVQGMRPLTLTQVSADQGELLIRTLDFTTSRRKK